MLLTGCTAVKSAVLVREDRFSGLLHPPDVFLKNYLNARAIGSL